MVFWVLFSFIFQIKRPSDRVLPPVCVNNADLCFDSKSLKPPLHPLSLCEVKRLSFDDLNLIENNVGVFSLLKSCKNFTHIKFIQYFN